MRLAFTSCQSVLTGLSTSFSRKCDVVNDKTLFRADKKKTADLELLNQHIANVEWG